MKDPPLYDRPLTKVIAHAITLGVVVALLTWLLTVLMGCQQTPKKVDPWTKPVKQQTDAELRESARHWATLVRIDDAELDRTAGQYARDSVTRDLKVAIVKSHEACKELHESWRDEVEAEIKLRETRKSAEGKRHP